MLCISNHTACRFAKKTLFFRQLLSWLRCAAASRFTFFKGETLSPSPGEAQITTGLFPFSGPAPGAAAAEKTPGDGRQEKTVAPSETPHLSDKSALGRERGAWGEREHLSRQQRGSLSPQHPFSFL